MSEQNVNVVEFTDVENNDSIGNSILGANLSVIESLEVELLVDVGSASLSVKELYELKKGQVVKLDSHVDQPLKLILGDNVVAEGVLVAIDEQYGIELTEIANLT